jgi:hypothetical protein
MKAKLPRVHGIYPVFDRGVIGVRYVYDGLAGDKIEETTMTENQALVLASQLLRVVVELREPKG